MNGEGESATARAGARPRHVAIVMDGNGRWARRRGLPRTAGHRAGVQSVRRVVEASVARGIEALTLFAFSSENWRRPRQEVGVLMGLFLTTLQREIGRLHAEGVRLRFIGAREGLAEKLRRRIDEAERLTAGNRRLHLTIAANYGGRWDIAQAARHLAGEAAAGRIDPEAIDAERFGRYVCLADLPEPDLLIRTGGEQRISNFLLWQIAYTELYFTDLLWPDFDERAYDEALAWYAGRERRFGALPHAEEERVGDG